MEQKTELAEEIVQENPAEEPIETAEKAPEKKEKKAGDKEVKKLRSQVEKLEKQLEEEKAATAAAEDKYLRLAAEYVVGL